MDNAPTRGDEARRPLEGLRGGELSGRDWVTATLAGVLMGLANLVPGVSGGTMLLACGVYPRFVDTLANLTLFRFRVKPILWLGLLGFGAILAVVLLAGTVKHLVLAYPSPMRALFIGLTLGGVPALWTLAKPLRRTSWVTCTIAFLLMLAMAFARPSEDAGGGSATLLFVSGIAGASAMVLPGISGSYLLLLLGQYVPVLSAIDRARGALVDPLFKGGAIDAAGGLEAILVLLPFAAGVAVGVATVPHLIRNALRYAPAASYGLLLGLLLGAVPGLWPFRGVPSAVDALLALAIAAAGFAFTRLASRLAPSGEPPREPLEEAAE